MILTNKKKCESYITYVFAREVPVDFVSITPN